MAYAAAFSPRRGRTAAPREPSRKAALPRAPHRARADDALLDGGERALRRLELELCRVDVRLQRALGAPQVCQRRLGLGHLRTRRGAVVGGVLLVRGGRGDVAPEPRQLVARVAPLRAQVREFRLELRAAVLQPLRVRVAPRAA
jgi:hypothetical protein